MIARLLRSLRSRVPASAGARYATKPGDRCRLVAVHYHSVDGRTLPFAGAACPDDDLRAFMAQW